MNQYEMVIGIILIVMVASIIKARFKYMGQRDAGDGRSSAEADRLRTEVAQLKDRLAVLERITVEKENSLARQIDELRDQ